MHRAYAPALGTKEVYERHSGAVGRFVDTKKSWNLIIFSFMIKILLVEKRMNLTGQVFLLIIWIPRFALIRTLHGNVKLNEKTY